MKVRPDFSDILGIRDGGFLVQRWRLEADVAIDATVRPRRRGHGEKRGVQAHALGHSCGGFGTKIHAVVDALGPPIRCMLGPGQQNDMARACDLIRGLSAKKVGADRAYDADSLCNLIRVQGGEPIIPLRRHRSIRRPYDVIADKQRWAIEAFLACIK